MSFPRDADVTGQVPPAILSAAVPLATELQILEEMRGAELHPPPGLDDQVRGSDAQADQASTTREHDYVRPPTSERTFVPEVYAPYTHDEARVLAWAAQY